jgi:hypothetical protein
VTFAVNVLILSLFLSTIMINAQASSDFTSGLSSDSGTGTQMGIYQVGVESPCNGKP